MGFSHTVRSTTEDHMSNADTHRELHDLFNGRDFDALAKRLTEDFRYTDQPRGVVIDGPAGFKAWLTDWTKLMSDARCAEPRYVDGGDTSVALFTGDGTNDGAMGPFPASGNKLRFPICEILTYNADGDVTGGEIYYDSLTLLVQAGVMEPPA